jgi:hypothetical protein
MKKSKRRCIFLIPLARYSIFDVLNKTIHRRMDPRVSRADSPATGPSGPGFRDAQTQPSFNLFIAHAAMPDDAETHTVAKTIYFGYGSNLWIDQMNRRCTENKYVGIGLLQDW